MARVSRPPGYDMTYRPSASVPFGPPLSERVPVLAYIAGALGIVGLIVYGQLAPAGSRMFEYVVEGDRHRMISSDVCAILLAVSALAAIAREGMRGVIVRPDGIELRELLPLGWPRVRRFQWSQIDRIFVPPAKRAKGKKEPSGLIRLDLWNGTHAWLPEVADPSGLAVLLEKVALARAIPLEGGTGLLDELGNPFEGAGEPAE